MKKILYIIPLLLLSISIFTPKSYASAKPLIIHFYFTPSCPLCEPTKQVVDAVSRKYGDKVLVIKHNHSESEESFNSMILALEYYNRHDTPNLVAFLGDKVLGNDEINENLDHTVAELLANGTQTPNFKQFGAASNAQIRNLYTNRATLGVIVATGLFDGLNPCAFATVILFVSMLAGIGRDRKTILAVGISFIIAVFLTYYALGALFFEIMGAMQGSASTIFKGIAMTIKWISLLMVVAAGILSIIDAFRAFRSGGRDKMLLVLPEKLKNKIRKRLRVTAHSGSLIAGAFVSGIVISFLEAACTGQTYMPIISALVADNTTAMRGYWLLLLYNILFIIPLLAVFFAVFFGMTSEQIGNLARKRVWITKLILGVMFLIIAVWLGDILLPTLIDTTQNRTAISTAATTGVSESSDSQMTTQPVSEEPEEIDENLDR